MGRDRDRGGLERLLGEREQDLMRAAVALTGSRADGEDLLQAALERLLRNWRRVDTDPEGYLRRTLYNLAADGWRSRGRWRSRLAEFRAQAPSEIASEDVAVVDAPVHGLIGPQWGPVIMPPRAEGSDGPDLL